MYNECYVESSVLKAIPKNFCYPCDSSPNATISSSKYINESSFEKEVVNNTYIYNCWTNAKYNDFCQVSKEISQCQISILPPVINNDRCKVEILNNSGTLEETLILESNGTLRSTSNTWNISRYKKLKYRISRMVSSNDMIRGKTLQFYRLDDQLVK